MKYLDEEVEDAGPLMDLKAFEAERDRVCAEFADHEVAKQPGQLGRIEYVLVGVMLVVTFALVLLLQ